MGGSAAREASRRRRARGAGDGVGALARAAAVSLCRARGTWDRQARSGRTRRPGRRFLPRECSPTRRMTTPPKIAMSATLKMPVRIGPMPTFRKSTTRPSERRSTQFEAPPAATMARPRRLASDQRVRSAYTMRRASNTPGPKPNSTNRTGSGSSAPKLKKEPGCLDRLLDLRRNRTESDTACDTSRDAPYP